MKTWQNVIWLLKNQQSLQSLKNTLKFESIRGVEVRSISDNFAMIAEDLHHLLKIWVSCRLRPNVFRGKPFSFDLSFNEQLLASNLRKLAKSQKPRPYQEKLINDNDNSGTSSAVMAAPRKSEAALQSTLDGLKIFQVILEYIRAWSVQTNDVKNRKRGDKDRVLEKKNTRGSVGCNIYIYIRCDYYE